MINKEWIDAVKYDYKELEKLPKRRNPKKESSGRKRKNSFVVTESSDEESVYRDRKIKKPSIRKPVKRNRHHRIIASDGKAY